MEKGRTGWHLHTETNMIGQNIRSVHNMDTHINICTQGGIIFGQTPMLFLGCAHWLTSAVNIVVGVHSFSHVEQMPSGTVYVQHGENVAKRENLEHVELEHLFCHAGKNEAGKNEEEGALMDDWR